MTESSPPKSNGAVVVPPQEDNNVSSPNAKACHQCRHKPIEFAAVCKNQRGNKPCLINYCNRCLMNRYGEKADEALLLDDWKCPKCRGICNCSVCMKRRGQRPTGLLGYAAKENGFSSASEWLQIKGPESLFLDKIFYDDGVSPKNPVSSEVVPNDFVALPRKQKKQNSLGSNGLTPCDQNITSPENMNGKGDGNFVKKKLKRNDLEKKMQSNVEPCIQLPSGSCLTSAAGVDLCPEYVGHALQFLEFCSHFGEVLDIKKGQAESVLREIINGRRARRSKHSSIAQIHIQLLSAIQGESMKESLALTLIDEKRSWLQAVESYVSDCQFMSKKFPSDCFHRGEEGYEDLDVLKKLKLLNFLCDESLKTKEVRDLIDGQKRETHERIKSETPNAEGKVPEEMGAMQKVKRSDAIKTKPIVWDANGHAFWRLKGYDDQKNILLQDLSDWDSDKAGEKWFVFEDEQRGDVEKYISSLRRKRFRVQKTAETIPIINNELEAEIIPVINDELEAETIPVQNIEIEADT